MMKNLTLTTIALFFAVKIFAQTPTVTQTTTNLSTITITNKNLSIVATFDARKAEQLKFLITKALGKPTENTKGFSFWNSANYYSIILRSQKLMIDMDKSKASASLTKTFEQLKGKIQDLLNNG